MKLKAASLTGNGQPWLNDNFFASADTAENYMKLARRFRAKSEAIRILGYTQLIQLLALPEGDEEDFIAAQVAAGRPVEKQSAREIQRNVNAFKQQRAAKKVPVDDKLPTLQGLSLPLEAPNDAPPDSSVTTDPEPTNDLYDNHADVPAEEIDDTLDIVDHNIASDILPAVDTLPLSMFLSRRPTTRNSSE